MKKIFFLLVCAVSFGQHTGKVAQTVLELQQQGLAFKKQLLFATAPKAGSVHSGIVRTATYATLDSQALEAIVLHQPELLEIEIPYQGKMIPLLLYKIRLHADNFHIDTDKAQSITVENGVHYRGIISKDAQSLVSFNFFKDQVNGIVSGNEYGNLTIGKLEEPEYKTHYIIYSDANLLNVKGLGCTTPKMLPDAFPEISLQSSNMTQNCVTVYFEIGYSLFQANGGSLSQTTAWINSVFNNVQTLFNNDGIKTAIKSVFIWTTPDPYSGANIYQYLDSFHANRPLFDGDVGQLLTTGTNLGGVAAVVNGLCSANNYLYSDVYVAFSNVPAYSWTVQSITHELGHIMGSPHTHDCVWNGNNTPIDGCGPTIGYAGLTPQGTTCNQTAPNPASGTIMSYCYAVNGIGNNFANGFGVQPAARIAQTIDAATCLGTDCITTCIATLNPISGGIISPDSYSISWTDNNPANTSWQVSAAAYPFVPTTWITVDSVTNHTFSDLDPNTYYRFFVRNNCGALISSAIGTNYVATIDFYCDGKSFTDTGGLMNNYQDYQDWTRTFFPIATPNSAVRITFSSIDIEAGYDFLHVYDGPDTNATELVTGGITGNTIVGPFTSTHPSGALTFRFISDTNTNGAGWNATTSCEALNISNPNKTNFTFSPNPVKSKLEINAKVPISSIAVFSIEGKLLYESNSIKNQIDFSGFASGTYIVKLGLDNKSETFKIIKQ